MLGPWRQAELEVDAQVPRQVLETWSVALLVVLDLEDCDVLALGIRAAIEFTERRQARVRRRGSDLGDAARQAGEAGVVLPAEGWPRVCREAELTGRAGTPDHDGGVLDVADGIPAPSLASSPRVTPWMTAALGPIITPSPTTTLPATVHPGRC